MKTTKLIFTIVLISITYGLSGCGVGEAGIVAGADAPAATPVPVEVATPTRGDVYATYRATATISSDSDAPATARVGGEVVELLAEEGDRVQQGQVLVRLDGERLRLEMLSAKANLEQAQKEYERNVDLHKRGLVSAAMFEGLKFDLDALSATYELKKLNYEYSNIRAPITGVVSSRDIKPGQNVNVDDVVYRVTETSELRAELHIPQVELAKISAGQQVVVEIDSMPGSQFPAEIARISPTIDTRNGTFRATALINNDHHFLAPGMFARFTIAYEKHEDALLVPADAIVAEDDQSTVFVVIDGEVSRRVVETGIAYNDRVEVLAGLVEGEYVVVVGHSGLRNGSKVLASNELPSGHAG